MFLNEKKYVYIIEIKRICVVNINSIYKYKLLIYLISTLLIYLKYTTLNKQVKGI